MVTDEPTEPPDALVATEPPADPDEWTDEQWIAWLEATDEREETREGTPTDGATPRRRSGGVMGQAMLGLAAAMYGEDQQEIVVVVEDDGEPEPDRPFAVRLDPDRPERSSVVFRRRSR